MVRPRSHLRCDVCLTEPEFKNDRFACRCPKFRWTPKKGCVGTAEDRELLERYGWRLVVDADGFVFWMGPGNMGVVYLYDDGTWCGGSEEFEKLEDYLNWYASGQQRPAS